MLHTTAQVCLHAHKYAQVLLTLILQLHTLTSTARGDKDNLSPVAVFFVCGSAPKMPFVYYVMLSEAVGEVETSPGRVPCEMGAEHGSCT